MISEARLIRHVVELAGVRGGGSTQLQIHRVKSVTSCWLRCSAHPVDGMSVRIVDAKRDGNVY